METLTNKLNYRFLNYLYYDSFKDDLENDRILPDTIVFIQDKRCIWARGKEYTGNVSISVDGETDTISIFDADGNEIYSARFVHKEDYERFVEATNQALNDCNDAISTEIERAEGAEEDLWNALGFTKEDIENGLDTVDQRLKDLQSTTEDLDAAIEAEETRAKAAEEGLAQNIGREINNRQTADDALGDRIDGVQSDLSDLDSKVDQEIQDRKDADSILDQKISDEINRAVEREDDVEDRLNQEIQDRKDADDIHDNRLNTLENLIEGNNDGVINRFNEIVDFLNSIEDTSTLEGILGGIATDIASGDEAVSNELAEEIRQRKEADNNLSDQISGVQTNLDNAVSDLTQADENLQNTKQDNLTAGDGISIDDDNTIGVIDYIGESEINAKLKTLQEYLGDLYVLKKDVRTPDGGNWSDTTVYPFGDLPEASSPETPLKTDIIAVDELVFTQMERDGNTRNDICYLITNES